VQRRLARRGTKHAGDMQDAHGHDAKTDQRPFTFTHKRDSSKIERILRQSDEQCEPPAIVKAGIGKDSEREQ